MYPLRETVVCVQCSLASARVLGVQAVGWDHHEDKVRQVLLIQGIQIQATVLLISIHALFIDMIEVHINQLSSGIFFTFINSLNCHCHYIFTQCRN